MLYLRDSPVMALKSATVSSFLPDVRTLRTISSSQREWRMNPSGPSTIFFRSVRAASSV